MKRDDINEKAIAVLVVAVVLLIVSHVVQVVRCWRQERGLSAQQAQIAALEQRLESHVNPPPEPTLGDKAMATYERAKAATVDGYDKAKQSTVRQYNRMKAAAASGYEAAKEAYEKN